jgi:hypothetical protein
MARPFPLRDILIYRKSGMGQFHHYFDRERWTRDGGGGLLGAFQDFSRQALGACPAYIALNDSALTFVQSTTTDLTIAFLHDVAFSRYVARKIATSILHKFAESWNPNPIGSTDAPFRPGAIGPAIRAAAIDIFRSLITDLRGEVPFAALFWNGNTLYTYPDGSHATTVGSTLSEVEMWLGELTGERSFELVVEADSVVMMFVLVGEAKLLLQIQATANSPPVRAKIKEALDLFALCWKTAEEFQ